MTEVRRLQATATDFGVLPQRLRAAMQRMDVAEHHLEQTSETRSARQVDLLGARSGAPGRRVEVSEPLTERELAVLRLLPAGLSNREIGRELYVSINTVRTSSGRLSQARGHHPGRGGHPGAQARPDTKGSRRTLARPAYGSRPKPAAIAACGARKLGFVL